jgi:DNA polymerase-4
MPTSDSSLDISPFNRKIIHVDMDAFYTSVEQRDRPELRGRPVVVGGDPHSRGVVASASYEARKFGIYSAMSCSQAFRLCPQTVFIYPNFDKYLKASRVIRQIFESVTPLVEPLALDEAYLDVTSNLWNEPLAKKIAVKIRAQIQSELGLTASAGVGPNKFIAKLASDMRKPNGLVVVPPEKVFALVENLPVEKLWGVGPATVKRLHAAGIKTTSDIRVRSMFELENILGSYAHFLFELAHGEDSREVDPVSDPKSRGTETTFDKDIRNTNLLLQHLETQAEDVSLDLKKLGRPGRTVTLKIKYSDFTSITRSRTLFHPTEDAALILKNASELLFKDTEVGTRAVRLIGISVSNLVTEEEPLQLWFEFPTYL